MGKIIDKIIDKCWSNSYIIFKNEIFALQIINNFHDWEGNEFHIFSIYKEHHFRNNYIGLERLKNSQYFLCIIGFKLRLYFYSKK